MYSLVIATMLTAGSTTPGWWGFGCNGSCYGGCYGWHSSCYGCYGNCYGCYGSCYGCYGNCYGCYGSCYGCYGCTGCYGTVVWYGCSGCYGGSCYGCYGCYGGSKIIIIQTPHKKHKAKKKEKQEEKHKKKAALRPNSSTVVVHLPEDADLFVDGQPVALSSAMRTLVTPPLEPNRDYYYMIKAEEVRNGKLVSLSKRVLVRAGKQVEVDFGNLAEAQMVGAAPAHVTVHLPADARLYVDGVVCPLKSKIRSFDTPALQRGRSYYYTLKAEIERNGRTAMESKRVIVQAGKKVEVDFGPTSIASTARR